MPHVSRDRAGSSLLVMSSDKRGIELGFWTPNLIFLGDDTSSAQAQIRLRNVAVINAPPFSIHLPPVGKN